MRVRFIRSCASVGSEGGSEGAVDDIGNDSENESTIDGSNGGDIACDESGDMSTDELELIDRSAKDCEPSDLNSACEVDCVPPASPLPSSLNSLTSTVSTRLSSQSLFDTDDRPGTPVGQWWSEDPGKCTASRLHACARACTISCVSARVLLIGWTYGMLVCSRHSLC